MKRFQPRRYDPDAPLPKRTEAQHRATERNFRIFKLRGLHTFSYLLTGERREAMQKLVDDELRLSGALDTNQHAAMIAAKWDQEEKTHG